jgi:hypothetical protein
MIFDIAANPKSPTFTGNPPTNPALSKKKNIRANAPPMIGLERYQSVQLFPYILLPIHVVTEARP